MNHLFWFTPEMITIRIPIPITRYFRNMRYSYLLLPFLLLTACTPTATPTTTSPPSAKYTPDWASLRQQTTPDWFRDAKFGIYFHWGPYSVPAYGNEWYAHHMYRPGHDMRRHHEATYGPLDEFGYKDFIPMWKGEQFDAANWVDLFKRSGAKFVGSMGEHADGFALWDSKLTEWDAVDKGPRRDIVAEMERATRAAGLKFAVTYHRQWLYAWYPTWDETTDAADPAYAGLYGPKLPAGTFVMAEEPTDPLPDAAFNQEWLDRLLELTENYRPDLVWFDNKMDIIGEDFRREFLARYYNQGDSLDQEVVVTYKFHDLDPEAAVIDLERARMSEAQPFPWLTDDSVDWNSWSHTNDPDYKSANRMIDMLVDIVSKNGCLLLNVPPTADGVIPEPVRERLLAMGEWLATNGEAIYGSRPWVIYGEGPTQVTEGHLSERENADNTAADVRFTVRDGFLYATALGWPAGDFLVKTLATGAEYHRPVTKVELLGHPGELEWEQTAEGLRITPPPVADDAFAYTFRLTTQP